MRLFADEDYVSLRTTLLENIDICRQSKVWYLLAAMKDLLGRLEKREGNFSEALRQFRQSLPIFWRDGNGGAIPVTVLLIAVTKEQQGDLEDAVVLAAAVKRMRVPARQKWKGPDKLIERARNDMDETQLGAALRRGDKMSDAEAVGFALREDAESPVREIVK